MKKIIIILALTLITTMPVFSQEPDINVYFGAGADFVRIKGAEIPVGLQVGAATEKLNFILEANMGFGFGSNYGFFFPYHLGGLVELKIANIFFTGVGGGMSGKISISDDSLTHPAIRGTISINFKDKRECLGTKVGLYYDYCFKYGFKMGIRYHICCLH